MKARIGIRVVPITALLWLASVARGETVSYTANLHTSKGNPVYDILILETDGAQVHATAYPSELPGKGTSVVSHDVPFTPTKSLVIGLTEGQDTDGTDKTELIMFLDRDFAAANVGVPFSSIFPGARHSVTVANLKAAAAGDTAQLAWFTDTFFPGPAAGAAFDPRGSFTVAEFTSLKNIGKNATAGNWMVNTFQSLSTGDPNAQSSKVTAAIVETAKVDTGPFDIELLIDGDSAFAIDKTVVNNTGVPWKEFIFQLGTGTGANFVLSTPGDGLTFVANLNNREETGAFPQATVVGEDLVVFNGYLPPGGTAHFVVFVSTDITTVHLVTIRQSVIAATTVAPALTPRSLAILAVLLVGLAALRLQRRGPGDRIEPHPTLRPRHGAS